MQEYNVEVLFEKGYVLNMPKKLVQNDYNLLKLNLNFDIDGRVVFKLLYPNREKFIVDEVIDHAIVFKDGYLSQEGTYLIEFALYDGNGRLTNNAISEIEVRRELISTDEIVEADDRVPILDNLINDVNAAIEKVENIEPGSGSTGTSGEDGATFIPSVSSEGILSWTNDKELDNPDPISIKGPKGDTGEQGPQGEQGPKGSDGTGVTILGSYENLEELKGDHPTGTAGDSYLIQGNLYVWSSTTSTWENVGSIQGPQGVQGLQGIQGIQGEKGEKGEKGDTGEQGPQGEIGPSGADGKSATIKIGTVTTGEAGTNATVTNSGTETDAIFNFIIPKGETGAAGTSESGTVESPLKGKKIVVLGDSISAGYLANTNWPTILGENTGATIVNLASTGATIAYIDGSADGNNFVNIANENKTQFTDADYLVIMGGGNDYRLNVPLGTSEDTGYITTLGALITLINAAQSANPRMKIFISTTTSATKSGMGLTEFEFESYLNGIEEVARLYHIPFLHLWSNFGLNPQISAVANIYYNSDGAHLTDAGQTYLADKMQKFLETEVLNNSYNAVTWNGYRLSVLTQAQYTSLSTKDEHTLYIVKG